MMVQAGLGFRVTVGRVGISVSTDSFPLREWHALFHVAYTFKVAYMPTHVHVHVYRITIAVKLSVLRWGLVTCILPLQLLNAIIP